MRRFIQPSTSKSRVLCILASSNRCSSTSHSFLSNAFLTKGISTEVYPYRAQKNYTDEEREIVSQICDRLLPPPPKSEDAVRRNKNILSSTEMNPFFGLDVSKEYGGRGLSVCAQALVYERLAAMGHVYTARSLQLRSLSTLAINFFGTEEQKKEYLTGSANGTHHIYLAMMEEEEQYYYEIGQCKSKAAISCSSNASYILEGKKKLINGSLIHSLLYTPTHYVVLAKTQVHIPGDESTSNEEGKGDEAAAPSVADRLTAFVVPATAAGVTRVGNEVHFKDVQVPVDSLLGPAGSGYRAFLFIRYSGYLTHCAILLGTMQRSLPQLQGNLHYAALYYACESLLYLVTGNVDHGVDDYIREVIALKVFITQASAEFSEAISSSSLSSVATTTTTISSSSSSGKANATDVLQAYQTVHEQGDNNLLLLYLACVGCEDFALHLGRSSTIEIMQQRTLRSFGFKEHVLPTDVVSRLSASLQNDLAMLEKDFMSFGSIVEKSVVKNGQNIIFSQILLREIGTLAMYLYARTSCLSRVAQYAKRTPSEDIALAHHFCKSAATKCQLSIARIANASVTLQRNTDEKICGDVLSASGYIVRPPRSSSQA